MRDAIVVCRLSSRHGLTYYRRLHDELPTRGVRIVAAHMVRRRRDLKKRIRQAVKSRIDLVVVIGGDGTQTAAVAELAHTDCTLAVVPAGTGNSFALSLGITTDIDRVIETIATGKELRVDVGKVNGTYFANFASIGLVAQAAKDTPSALKRIIGPVAYGFAVLVPLFRRRPFSMRVRWPGNSLHLMTHQAIVSSGRYFGWQPLLPDANVRSGELAFFAAVTRTPAGALQTNTALLRGEQTNMDNAHYFYAPHITVRTKPRQPLNIDGHALGKTPARFSIVPRALRVLVPRDFETQR